MLRILSSNLRTGDHMWRPVIIVQTNRVGPSCGSSSSIAQMTFTTEQQCSIAAAQITGSGDVVPEKGGSNQIIAKCVLRSSNR